MRPEKFRADNGVLRNTTKMSTSKGTKKVSAFAAFSSKIKNGRSATSKARSSQPAISPTAILQYDKSNLLKAFEATQDGMSISAAAKQYGVPKSTLWGRVRGKVFIHCRRSQPPSKPTAPPTERHKLHAVQATQKRRVVKPSKQINVPESTFVDKARSNAAKSTRQPRQSSKSTMSRTARCKTSLRNAVQATLKGKSVIKTSKQDCVPKSTRPKKTRGSSVIESKRPQQFSKPATSQTARCKRDESVTKAAQAPQQRKSASKPSKQDGVSLSTLPWKPRGKGAKGQPVIKPITSPTERLQYEEASLVNAFQATKEGMSVYKASRQYGVPESTLRDRTRGIVSINRKRLKQFIPSTPSLNKRRQYMQYDKANMVKAVQAVQNGMPVCKAVRQFGVPDSTFCDKNTVTDNDDNTEDQQSDPSRVKKIPRRQYAETNLIKAFRATQEGASVYRAARQYGVPESTLRDRTRGNVPVEGAHCGPEKIFTRDEEQEMVDHIKHMARIGYEYSRLNIKSLAADFAHVLGKGVQANKSLSNNWYTGFMKRWSDLHLVLKPKKLSGSTSQEALDTYFKELATIFIANNLCESPEHIYVIDGYCLSKKQIPQENVSDATTKLQAVQAPGISIIGGGNASGYYIPPYFVFPGKRWTTEMEQFVDGAPPGTAAVMSHNNSLSNSDILNNYLQRHFANYAYLRDSKRKGYKTLILYDGHKYHFSLLMEDWAKKNHVILFVLPPYASHVTRPKDAGLFRRFKAMYSCECKHYYKDNPGVRITNYDVARLAAKPYLQVMSNLKAEFRQAGVYPLSNLNSPEMEAVLSTICPPSSDDEDSGNSTVWQSDCQTNLNPTVATPVTNPLKPASTFPKSTRSGRSIKKPDKDVNVHVPSPACSPTKKRSTTSSDEVPASKKSCPGITLDSGSNITDLETQLLNSTTTSSPLPGTSGRASVILMDYRHRKPVSQEETNCCVCGGFSPPGIKHCSSLILVKWAQCDKCEHWTHLSFCTDVSVVRNWGPFLCPHCRGG